MGKVEVYDSIAIRVDDSAPTLIQAKAAQMVSELIMQYPDRFLNNDLYTIRQLEVTQNHKDGSYSLGMCVFARELSDPDADMEYLTESIDIDSELGQVTRRYIVKAIEQYLIGEKAHD